MKLSLLVKPKVKEICPNYLTQALKYLLLNLQPRKPHASFAGNSTREISLWLHFFCAAELLK